MYKQYKKDLNLGSLSPLVLVKDIIYTGNTNVYMVSCESRHYLKKKKERWGGGGSYSSSCHKIDTRCSNSKILFCVLKTFS